MIFFPKSQIRNPKFEIIIEVLLILLLIFTPIAFGSQVLWAFSMMELGILLIVILGTIQLITNPLSANISKSDLRNPKSSILKPQSSIRLPILLLSLFLGIVLLQIIPLPAGVIKIVSPKTYELKTQLSVAIPVTDPQSSNFNPQSWFTLTLFPLATKIEFFKWLALAGLFAFLLHWRLSDNRYRVTHHLIIAIFFVGVFESLYGIFEFFSGHRHILNLDWSSRISSVTGTFVNRNYFAGYLLMVIPLSVGFLFSREANKHSRFRGWRHRLSSLDGKTLLLMFGAILMILGLLLSASRMGIISLFLSFSLISILFGNPQGKERVSRVPVLIFGLALLWTAWIGLDAVISRFFTASEGLESRWMIWVNTFGIFKDFPLLGSGLGTFAQVFSMYRSFHIVGLHTHAENDFLQLASEVGLLGAGTLLILFLFLLYKAAVGLRSLCSGEPQRYIAIGGMVGILALMFHSIVERNIQVPANAFLYTVIWATVLQTALDSRSKGIATKGAPEAPNPTHQRLSS